MSVRVGIDSSFFSSYGDAYAYVDRVNIGVDDLGSAIREHQTRVALPNDFSSSWAGFTDAWKRFRSEAYSQGGPLGMTAASIIDATKQYETQLAAYRERFKTLGGKVAAPAPAFVASAPSTNLTPYYLAAGAALVGWFVYRNLTSPSAAYPRERSLALKSR